MSEFVEQKEYTWMVYEDNQTWAIPKRPKFVIKGTTEAVDRLVKQLNYDREEQGQPMLRDTKMTADIIRSFDSVEQYNELVEAKRQSIYEDELNRRAGHTARSIVSGVT